MALTIAAGGRNRLPRFDHHALPGKRLTLTATVTYLAVLVIVPLAACAIKAFSLSRSEFIHAVWTERAKAAYSLTIGASLVAAIVDAVLGTLIAWVLVRYEFPGKRIVDSLVDLPFALPTAVAGLVFSDLYVPTGWLGRFLVPLGIDAAYSRLAIVLVLTFVGLPFVVRTVQPVLEELDPEVEEASGSLGASRLETFRSVLFPQMMPAVATGLAMAFARALGEYGSVVFVSGNMPFRTEIAPVLIVAHLEAFKYSEATAVAVVMLVFSFAMLAAINLLQRWSAHANA